MATPKREGLRVRLLEPTSSSKKSSKSNSERCKEYRHRLKDDPMKLDEYRLKYLQRNMKNRQRQLGPEEDVQRREKNKMRQQRYRDRQKATRNAITSTREEATSGPVVTRRQKHEANSAIDAEREKWRMYKRNERQQWSSQKRRRNREKALDWYYKNKRSSICAQLDRSQSAEASQIFPSEGIATTGTTTDTPPFQSHHDPSIQNGHSTVVTPLTREAVPEVLHHEQGTVQLMKKKSSSKEGERKALYRVKKAVSNLKPRMFQKLLNFFAKETLGQKKNEPPVSPSADKVKSNVETVLDQLKPKRSKKSLVAKKLILDAAVQGECSGKDAMTYQRTKLSMSTSKLKEFIDDVSVTLPGKKTVDRMSVQKMFLPKSVRHLEQEFKSNFPAHNVSRATFYRHIPKHVLTSAKHRHRSCLCEICVAIDSKLDVLNKHVNFPFEGRDSLSEMSLCHEVTLDCLRRICKDCGVKQVQEVILNQIPEENLALTVKWFNWEASKDSYKKVEPVEKVSSLGDMCDKLMDELSTFSLHLFVFRWQYSQFKLCRTTISKRQTFRLVVLDFSENFTCRPQDEVQSAYYGYTQVTVHPSVTYYACPIPECSEVVTEYIVFMSSDLNHDGAMAQSILNKTVEHLEFRVPGLQQLAVFSDGCAAQYKSKLPFHYLSSMSSKIQIHRAYFGSRHGKGPCDACGGVVKKAVERAILARQTVITNAQSMFQHCKDELTIPSPELIAGTCCHTRRVFVLLNENEIDRNMKSSELKTLPGTRKLHHIKKNEDRCHPDQKTGLFLHGLPQ